MMRSWSKTKMKHSEGDGEMKREYYWQATSFPDCATGMFTYVDTPCETFDDCKRQADKTFGPGKYTIKRVKADHIVIL